VGFRFYKKKPNRTEPKPTKNWEKNRAKTEPNRKKPSQNRKKPSQNRENRAKTEKTESNWFEPVFALKKPNRTEPNLTRFRFGFGFFFKNFFSVWLLFLIKTEPNRK
jgi:hypothetical protein